MFSLLMIDLTIDKMSRIVGMNFYHKGKRLYVGTWLISTSRTGRMKELRASTQLDLGDLFPEYMWIPMAVILTKGRSFIGVHINVHNCAEIQYLSIWLILKRAKIHD